MKWFFGLIAAVVVIIIAAIVIVPMVVDPNDFKPEIVKAVKSSTGRDLVIRDDMNLSVFPSVAIKLSGVSLSNAAGFSPENMASVEEVDLKVAVMPLLSGSLEVDTVVVRGLELNLAKDKKGKTNWDDLASGESSADDSSDAAQSGAAADLAVQIKGIDIEDATLTWDDKEAGTHYEIGNLSLKTGSIASGKEVPVDLGVTLKSASPAQSIDIALNTRVTANKELTQLTIADLVVALSAAGEGLPSGGLDLELKANIDLDHGAGTVAISDLALNGANVTLTGALDGSDLNGSPKFTGNFKLAESNLRDLMALGGAVPETADPTALSRVAAEFGVQATSTSAALKPFSVKLDDSTFSGDFNVKSFTGPALRFALNLDRIDLDRYLPPKSDEPAEAAAPTPSSPAGDDPLAALRPLDIVGSVRIGQLKVVNLNTANLGVDIKSKGGVLNLDSIAAELYEGKVSGNVRLDARKAEPTLEINNALNGIQINPLMTDFSGNEKLAGQGSVDVALRMRGLDATKIKQTLNGTINVVLTDGAYKGVDVIKTICSVGSKLDSLLSGATGDLDESGDTEFSAMSAKIVFVDGIASNDDLDVKSPLLRVTGSGGANLPEDTVDYLVKAELVKACEGQSGASADKLVGVPLPIRASGPMASPKIAPDWATLGTALAGSKLKESATTLLKDKLKIPGLGGSEDASTSEDGSASEGAESAGDALKKGLKSLF